jgi:hypothetical protein
VDEHVVDGTEINQVVQAGAAAVGPVLDVVQVGAAGLAAGEPAAAVVAVAGGAALRGGWAESGGSRYSLTPSDPTPERLADAMFAEARR